MKKIIILTLSILFGINMFGQTLLSPNKTWMVLETPVCGTKYTNTYQITGSTVIDGHTYYQVDQQVSNFLLREEGDKIYQRYESSDTFSTANTDWLLYDFSVTTSDTVTVYSYLKNHITESAESITFVVDSVDTVMFAGMPRKRIFLTDTSNSYLKDIWYQGVGSKFGLIPRLDYYGYPSYSSYLESDLNCYYEDDVLLYSNPIYSGCDYHELGIDKVATNTFKIYPNPAKEFVYIENLPSKISVIEVCDITGKTVKIIDLDKTQSIDIKNLKQGVYFVKAERFVRRLIKQ